LAVNLTITKLSATGYEFKEKDYRAPAIETPGMIQYMLHSAHAATDFRPEQRHPNDWRSEKRTERKPRRLLKAELTSEPVNYDTPDHCLSSGLTGVIPDASLQDYYPFLFGNIATPGTI